MKTRSIWCDGTKCNKFLEGFIELLPSGSVDGDAAAIIQIDQGKGRRNCHNFSGFCVNFCRRRWKLFREVFWRILFNLNFGRNDLFPNNCFSLSRHSVDNVVVRQRVEFFVFFPKRLDVNCGESHFSKNFQNFPPPKFEF